MTNLALPIADSGSPDGKAIGTIERVFNGKEPTSGANTFLEQRVDDSHLKASVKGPKGGNDGEFVVSPDGKTLTVTSKGTALSTGQPIDDVRMYTKQ